MQYISFLLIIFFSILKSGLAVVLREPLQMNGELIPH